MFVNNPILLNAFAPTVPMWAVLYQPEDNTLDHWPVSAIVIMEVDGCRFLECQVCGRDGFEDPQTFSNFLGYSDKENSPMEEWMNEIKRYNAEWNTPKEK